MTAAPVEIRVVRDHIYPRVVRWALYKAGDDDPFLTARRCISAAEDAYHDAETLMYRCDRPCQRGEASVPRKHAG